MSSVDTNTTNTYTPFDKDLVGSLILFFKFNYNIAYPALIQFDLKNALYHDYRLDDRLLRDTTQHDDSWHQNNFIIILLIPGMKEDGTAQLSFEEVDNVCYFLTKQTEYPTYVVTKDYMYVFSRKEAVTEEDIINFKNRLTSPFEHFPTSTQVFKQESIPF